MPKYEGYMADGEVLANQWREAALKNREYERIIREAVKRLEALSSKLLEGEVPKECAGDAAAEVRDLLAAVLEEHK